ncbi:HAAS signaling domain-containing protein, partial [Pseudonocardia abyssalis]
MTADVHGTAQREYLDGLRDALSDLPATEVSEILDDVAAHLSEVGAELGTDADRAAFGARLGTPRAYAAELRAAAGYPSAPQTAPADGEGAARFALVALLVPTGFVLFGGLTASFDVGSGLGFVLFGLFLGAVAVPVVWRGGPRMTQVAALPAVRRAARSVPDPYSAAGRLTAFVASLQPAWWLLRAVLAAAVVVGFVLGVRDGAPLLLLAVLLVPVSVWLGFRTRVDRRLLWLVVPLNAFAALVALALPVAFAVYGAPRSAITTYNAGLWQDDRRIEDIRPVDADGVPLTGVYLFDQDGRPIDTPANCYDDSGAPIAEQGPSAPYPRGTSGYDARTGGCVAVPPGP